MWEQMRQSMKAMGMSDEQIEETIKMQQAAMGGFQDMAANMMGAAANMMGGMAGALSDIMNDDGSYFEFAEPSTLSASYQWAVACGADLIHMRGDIINDLSTGNDADDIQYILKRDWGIKSKEDFSAMAESLKKGRHSKVYAEAAKHLDDEDNEYAGDIIDAMEAFAEQGLIENGDIPDMLIWDIGRLINITRFAFDAGYISRDEALAYLKDSALLVKASYSSWKELSIGYQFGRAVWGGADSEQFEMMIEGMQELLTEEDSPWVTLPFDMELEF